MVNFNSYVKLPEGIYTYIHICHLLYSPDLNRTSFGTRFLSDNYASNALRYFPSPTSVPCKGVSSIMRHDDNSSSATTQRFQFRRGWWWSDLSRIHSLGFGAWLKNLDRKIMENPWPGCVDFSAAVKVHVRNWITCQRTWKSPALVMP